MGYVLTAIISFAGGAVVCACVLHREIRLLGAMYFSQSTER